MTTKKSPARPVGSMTKQIVSFGASFAFFGLAGFLQNGAFFDTDTAIAAPSEEIPAADIVDTDNGAASAGAEVVASQEATVQWLGPVQPLPAEASAPAVDAVAPAPAPEPAPAVAPAPAPAPEPAPAPAEVAVDAHTGGS